MRYLGLTALVSAGVLSTALARADVVTDWNEIAVDVGRRLALGSNRTPRLLAITHLAIYDAVESVRHNYRPYSRYFTPRSTEISIEAAAAQAAHDALLWLNPSDATRLDAELARSLGNIDASATAKANGIELGRAVASEIVYSRLSDGSLDVETYDLTIPPDPSAGGASSGGATGSGGASSGGSGNGGSSGASNGGSAGSEGGVVGSSGGSSGGATTSSSGGSSGGATNGGTTSAGAGPVNPIPGAGLWRPTPRAPSGGVEPAGASALEPQWRSVEPFALASPSALRATVAVPPALTDAAYTAAYNEVKTLGAFSGSARSAEQTDIANFWRQETQVPFNAIARGVAAQKGLGIEENARLFALLNIALADARIAIWDVKYLRGFWRPITAIRLGERDGNAATSGDAAWRPLLETPAHPSYVSGHSGTGAAGAAVLAALFGDKTSFSVASDTLLGKVRTFDSFSAAALENAESRIYGGIHFRFDNEQGLALGKAIGEYVVANALLPADDLGSGGVGGAEGGGAGGVPVETGSGGISLGGALGKGGHSNGGAVAHGGNDTGGVVGEAGNGGHPGEPGSGGRAPSGGVGGKPSVPGGDDDDGCSCSVPGRPLASSAPWALVLAALVTWKRRRNRRTTG